ncbi:MAG: tyrosine-type recombinase/integrase [Dehalococcoidia bacterium]
MSVSRAIPATFEDSASGWERALYAFLAEKERRSGSKRTVQAYSRMLQDFFGRVGKTPDQVTSQDVFAYAHGIGHSGREPSAVTVGARAACISSFYRFLIRMGALNSNPADALERPKAAPAPPRGLSADQVRQLLAVIPETPAGLRDRAIILTLVLTGRRRSEVLNLTAGDLSFQSETVFYQYVGKGRKHGRRELPRPAYEAIARALAAFGKDLASMGPDESLWRAVGAESGITDGTAYLRFRRYLEDAGLPASGLHVLRHSAAKLRRDAGESVETVSAFLDHSSLAATTTYLRRLEGQQDSGWTPVAEAIGVGTVS